MRLTYKQKWGWLYVVLLSYDDLRTSLYVPDSIRIIKRK